MSDEAMRRLGRNPYSVGPGDYPLVPMVRQENMDPDEAMKLAGNAVVLLQANRVLSDPRVAEVAGALLRRAKSLLGLEEKESR